MEKKDYGKWIVIFSIIACSFVLGAMWGKYLENKSMEKLFDSYIQKYDFEKIAYSPIATDDIPMSFTCILGEKEELARVFQNVFQPAVNKFPVCFVNTHNYNSTEGDTNEST